ncbi:hypothetical protein V6N13_062063 [Hibiscus sabdariffa]
MASSASASHERPSMYFQLSAFPVGLLNWSSQNLMQVQKPDPSCMWYRNLFAIDFSCRNKGGNCYLRRCQMITTLSTMHTIKRKNLECSTIVQYGTKLDFREIFATTNRKWGNVDVGVFVCGPPTLQSSVAKEIRSHNLRRQLHDTIFHFNSHSFDL